MATQVSSRKQFTPLIALQIFATALIGAVAIMSVFLIVMKTSYDWHPFSIGYAAFTPVYAVGIAAVCLVLSFLIPEFLLESVRDEYRMDNSRQLSEDLPFVFVPSIFIRYALLAMVTAVGFIMTFTGRGVSVFIPFAAISLILMVAYFPTESRLKGWLRATK